MTNRYYATRTALYSVDRQQAEQYAGMGIDYHPELLIRRHRLDLNSVEDYGEGFLEVRGKQQACTNVRKANGQVLTILVDYDTFDEVFMAYVDVRDGGSVASEEDTDVYREGKYNFYRTRPQ